MNHTRASFDPNALDFLEIKQITCVLFQDAKALRIITTDTCFVYSVSHRREKRIIATDTFRFTGQDLLSGDESLFHLKSE